MHSNSLSLILRGNERFENVKSQAELSIKIVETNRHTRHEVVYTLLKLVLILPVAAASVERIFNNELCEE